MNKYLVLIILLLLVLAFFAAQRTMQQMTDPELFGGQEMSIKNYYLNLEFNGVVLDKFKDPENHYSNTLVITSFLGSTDSIVDDFDMSGFYDFAAQSDSVVKKKGGLEIVVYRNQMDSTFQINFQSRTSNIEQ